MNKELSALAEISSKPLEELSKEEMARLVIPFLDMTQLKLKCTTHEPFSPLQLNSRYPEDEETNTTAKLLREWGLLKNPFDHGLDMMKLALRQSIGRLI